MKLSPQARKKVGLAVGVAGLVAAVAGLVLIARKKAQLGQGQIGFLKPKYRFVDKRYPQAPAVGSTTNGGMKTTLRRSAVMPIEERVASIQDLVFKGVQDPEMRKLALKVTSHCPERDGLCEARSIYDYMKKRIRYTGDIAPIAFRDKGETAPTPLDGDVEGIDLFQSGKRTLEFGGGDCDDHTGLAATLLALNGIMPRLRVTAPSRHGEDSHIYPIAGLDKENPRKWIALDTTLPGSDKFGVEYPAGRITDFPA